MVQDKLEHFLKLFKDNIGADFPFSIPKNIVDLPLDSIPSHSRDGIFFGYPQNTKLYVKQEQKELFFEEVKPDYFVFGMWGHGLNSHAQYFFFVDKNTKIACRLMHGGIYMDNESRALYIREIYKKLKILIKHPNRDKHQVEFMDFGDVNMGRFDGIDLEKSQSGIEMIDKILNILDQNKPFIPTIKNFQQYIKDVYGEYLLKNVFETKGEQLKYRDLISDTQEITHKGLREYIRPKNTIKNFVLHKAYDIIKEKFSEKNINKILKRLENQIKNLKIEAENEAKIDTKIEELTERKKLIQSKEFKAFYNMLIEEFSYEMEDLWSFAIYDLPGFDSWIDFSNLNLKKNKCLKPILIIGLDPSPAIKEKLGICYGIGRPTFIQHSKKQKGPEEKFLQYYSDLFGLNVDGIKTEIFTCNLSPIYLDINKWLVERFAKELGITDVRINPVIKKANKEIENFKEKLRKVISEFKVQEKMQEIMIPYFFEKYTLNLINLINPELIVFNGVGTYDKAEKIFNKKGIEITELKLDKKDKDYQSIIQSLEMLEKTPFFLKGNMKSGKIKIVKEYDFMTLYHVSQQAYDIREATKGFFKKFIQKEYLEKLQFGISEE
jgi:hypothetical protein